jgi:purine-nucleoside phosphorylase
MDAPTVHNSAKLEDIAETILLPGDPLRAKFIAENFLDNIHQYTQLRGILGYTGLYKGVRVSVQGTGMGGPSMGIYSYELIHAYQVKRLIRIGSAGALQENIDLGDLIGVTSASYDTDYKAQLELPGTYSPSSSFLLLQSAYQKAIEMNKKIHMGPILSSDIFYTPHGLESLLPWKKMGLLAVEMEAASLFLNAQMAKVDAMCLLTVSDLPFSDENMSAEQREKSLTDMITIGLEVAIS